MAEEEAQYEDRTKDPEYQEFLAWKQNQASGIQPPIGTTGSASLDDIQRIVDQALERQRAEHKAEIDSLRAEIKARTPATAFPTDHPITPHAGGIGESVEETWSQYDQELAAKGIHPLQLKLVDEAAA